MPGSWVCAWPTEDKNGRPTAHANAMATLRLSHQDLLALSFRGASPASNQPQVVGWIPATRAGMTLVVLRKRMAPLRTQGAEAARHTRRGSRRQQGPQPGAGDAPQGR